ncbi:RTA1 like protein [Martensiomyces pterosporus]|nr:RTA1 like protein [Martensiomyces pterosporus]
MTSARKYFTYIPVHGAPEAAAVVFAAVAILIAVKTHKTSSPKWVHILTGTAIAECIGYALRAVCIDHASLGIYIGMTLFLLLPPNAFALFEYKTVGEVVRRSHATPRHFWLRPRFITWFFFSSDVFSFLLQSAGGSMMASESTTKTGKWVALIGLAIQLFFLTCFLFIAVHVTRDIAYTVAMGPRDKSPEGAKKKLMYTVIAATALIYIRSVYRLIEFADGYGGKIYSCEWAFYVFDCAMILLAFVANIVFFVGHHFNGVATSDTIEMLSTKANC